MATISVQSTVTTSVSTGVVKWTATYSVTNSETTTTVAVTSAQREVVSGSPRGNPSLTVSVDGVPILEVSEPWSGNVTKSFSRGHTASTKYIMATFVSGSTSASFSVPAKSSYTVAYNANGGGTAPASQTKWYGENLTLQGAITNRTNYVFKNWNTAANGSGTSYNAGATYTGNAALALYAQWYAPYTVSYDANGGTGAPANQTKVHNANLTLTNAKPAREGYRFVEWNTASDGTGTSYQPGAVYSTNANLALHAIWWKDPTVGTLEAYRCDSEGNADELGGYVKVSFDWLIEPDQTTGQQTAPTAFSVTAGAFSDTTVPSATSGTYSNVLGDGTVKPDEALTVTATVSDLNGTATSTLSIPASQSYFRPLVTASCIRVNANGDPDILGKHFRVTGTYSVYPGESGAVPQSLVLEARENGQRGTTALLGSADITPSASSGSFSHTFGPYDYTVLDPYTGYNQSSIYTSDGLFKATLSDAFYSASSTYELHTEGYARPSVTSTTSYRTEAQTFDGVTTYVESDEGTNCMVEVGWTVLSSGTSMQSNPHFIVVEVTDVETGTLVATRTVQFQPVDPSATKPVLVDVHFDPTGHPEDVPYDLVGGELLDVAKRYLIGVTISDLYTDEKPASKATGSDTLTPAFFTMDFLAGGHGIGIGGAATRKMLDVHMPAQFDDGTRVSELFSLPVYFYIGAVPSESQVPVKPCLLVPLNTVLQDGTQGSYANDPSVWLCYEQPHYTVYVLGESGWDCFQDQRTGVGGSSTKDFEWELAPGKYRIDVTGTDTLEMQAKCTDGSVTVYEADSTSLVHAQISSSEYADVSVGYLYHVAHRVYVDYAGEGTASLLVTGGLFWEQYLSI